MFFGLFKLVRPKQWVKNFFVFAAVLFSGQFLNFSALTDAFYAFMLFTIASSATYILNDIRDIEADKLHPVKSKKRPLASGQVSLFSAYCLLFALYSLLILGLIFNREVMLVVLAYIILNYFYSFYLKHQPVLDIFTISAGFVLRVLAGTVAIDEPMSSWMFITTLSLALFLASIKRRQELLKSGDISRSVLKSYTISLVDKYAEMSASCALMFYSLFIMSERPEMVPTIPFVLFGLYRYWYIVESLDGGESPTDALFSDWQLIIAILLWVVLCIYFLIPGVV